MRASPCSSPAAALSVVAASLPLMLLGRILQGFGAAAPRIVVVALVRDEYAGAAMARIMSLVLTTFILVPMVAPAIGQGILLVAHWRAIFAMLLALGLVGLVWFALRQPETLPLERRVRFSLGRILLGVRETCANRVALGYTIAAGMIFGAFLGYITSSAQIFLSQYGVGPAVSRVFRRAGAGDRRRHLRQLAPRHALRHAAALGTCRGPARRLLGGLLRDRLGRLRAIRRSGA